MSREKGDKAKKADLKEEGNALERRGEALGYVPQVVQWFFSETVPSGTQFYLRLQQTKLAPNPF